MNDEINDAIRIFEGGATRDTVEGKLHPYGFSHPLCDFSFHKYMNIHRLQSDGSLREPDNWWKGWDKKVSVDCLARHVEDLKLLHAGYRVFKERCHGREITHVIKPGEEFEAFWHEVNQEEACNAIRFNADAYKLDILTNGKV